jgi:nicotinate-nucleotide pyrophosphorylase (carboxylating)
MGMSMKDIVAKAKQHAPHSMTVQVEATTVQEALDAVEGGVDMIMLDNMNADEMRQAVNVLPDHIKTEASGGVTLDNVRAAAMAGVDYISSGAFIHSVKTLNLSLELEAATLRL